MPKSKVQEIIDDSAIDAAFVLKEMLSDPDTKVKKAAAKEILDYCSEVQKKDDQGKGNTYVFNLSPEQLSGLVGGLKMLVEGAKEVEGTHEVVE